MLNPRGADERAVVASVIIPTYRRFEYVISTINDLLSQSRSDFEIVIADQNESWPEDCSGLVSKLSEHEQVKWLKVRDRGVVNARHLAVERSQGEILVFVDDDISIRDREFIDRHLRNYADSGIDAVLGRELSENLRGGPSLTHALSTQYWQSRPLLQQAISFPRDSRLRVEVCCFCTCNASVRKAAFLKVGGFDEGFEGASYGDDYDFAIRLVKAGGRIVFDPTCEVVHLKAPIGGLRLSDKCNSFSERDKALSGFIFVLRHGRSYRPVFLFYSWVLRRTVLLRKNVLAPWRLGLVFLGLARAYRDARKVALKGPWSRFQIDESLLQDLSKKDE